MTSSRLDLGVGIVAVAGLDLMWEEIADLVDVVEVEPQTLWEPDAQTGWRLCDRAFAWLEQLTKPKICHGVGFPVGGSEPPDPAGVMLAATSAKRLGAAHWSEHLSLNRARIGGISVEAGFLLPPLQTWATIDAAAEHIAAYRQQLDRPFLIETGANYLRPVPEELPDGDFIAHVVERGDCGILLDLHNLWTNERNGRQSVSDVLAALPLERVLEVHLAGGFEMAGYYLDAHAGAVPAALLDIAAAVLPRLPNVRALVYESLPEQLLSLGPPAVRDQLESLRRLLECPQRASGEAWRVPPPRRSRRRAATARERADLVRWEQRFIQYTTHATARPPRDDPAFDLLRFLTDQARLGRIVAGDPDLVRKVVEQRGGAQVEAAAAGYLRSSPAHLWATDEANAFAKWLAASAAFDTDDP
jgi:uncharacterized protein (UPF0276 family)